MVCHVYDCVRLFALSAFLCCVINHYYILKWLEMDCPCWIIWLCVVDIYLVIFIVIYEILLLMLCLRLRRLEGQMLYFNFSMIDVRRLCCLVNHIAWWCHFEMTICFMMIHGYSVFGHISDYVYVGFNAMVIYFILALWCFMWKWVM